MTSSLRATVIGATAATAVVLTGGMVLTAGAAGASTVSAHRQLGSIRNPDLDGGGSVRKPAVDGSGSVIRNPDMNGG